LVRSLKQRGKGAHAPWLRAAGGKGICTVYQVLANTYHPSNPNHGAPPMSTLTIVAHIHAHPGQIDRVQAELEKLVPTTREEAGCLRYDLHRDNDDPAHFMFYETWESRPLWQDHMNGPHLAAYREATDGAVAQFTLYEMARTAC